MRANRCLTPLCIVAAGLLVAIGLAQAPIKPSDLVAHWAFFGDLRDHSGNNLHGAGRDVVLTASGPFGSARSAVRFNGRTSTIEVPDARSLRLGTAEFTLALWLHVSDVPTEPIGDLVCKYDRRRRAGFNLSATSRSGVTHSQANLRHLHFGIDDGRIDPQWFDCGRPGNAILIHSLAVHDGALFAGTCEAGKGEVGHVYRFRDRGRWEDCRCPIDCNSISALAVFVGKLYAGSAKYRLAGSSLPESPNANPGGQVFRYDGEQRWVDCGKLPDTDAVGSLVGYGSALYASSLYKPPGLFRYDGKGHWTPCKTPNGRRVESLCVFSSELFAASYDDGHVFRFDGKEWHDCGQVGGPENTQTYGFAVHGGKLYVGTWRSGRVFRYDGDNRWADLGRLGNELEVMGLAVHNGKLYGGTLPSADVYRYDGGTTWTNTGSVDRTPDVKYRRAWTMAEYRGKLHCGTLPAGRVQSLEVGWNVTFDHSLPPGWHHIAAVRDRNKLRLFLDGRQVAESDERTGLPIDVNSDAPLQIGLGGHGHLHGELSDVRIYKRALSEGEIREHGRKER